MLNRSSSTALCVLIAVAGLAVGSVASAKPAAPAPSKPDAPATPAKGESPTKGDPKAEPKGEPKAEPKAEPKKEERAPSAKGTMFLEEVKVVKDGFRFTEGPIYISTGKYAGEFVFSDIPNSVIHRIKLDPAGKHVAETLRTESGAGNGNFVDGQGMLVTCEGEGRVTRGDYLNTADAKAKPTVLASEFEGKRLNSPNDLAIGKAGDIYFSDPAYFVPKGERKLEFEGVFRITPAGKLELVSKEYTRPNGVCLSPDGKLLYVGDAGAREIWVHEVNSDGSTGPRKLFADVKNVRGGGAVDGLKCDKDGNVYSTGPGGIWCFSSKGEWLDRLAIPGASNFCFGGEDGKTVFITVGSKVATSKVKVGVK